MKAQRRHELKTNELARGLEHAPEFFRRYGGKILAALIVLVLAIYLLYWRTAGARRESEEAAKSLSGVRYLIGELKNTNPLRTNINELAKLRADIARDAAAVIDAALKQGGDPKIQANVLVARGDLNWTLANLPDMPSAATQPAMQFKQNESELLKSAEEAYQEVLNRFPDEPLAVASAHFGLAAVAENRADWGAAARHYQMVAGADKVPPIFKQQAEDRLVKLEEIRRPVLIGEPATQPVFQTTQPAATQSAVETQPAVTQPVP